MKRLPPRQLQVVQFLSQGFTAKEIAIELEISVNTVKNHISWAKSTVNATTAAHLVANCFRLGEIE